MIELYYWPTPNGHKITLFLEEAGVPYEIRPVNIGAGDQFKPDYLKFSPNNRMPAIIDTAPADGGESPREFGQENFKVPQAGQERRAAERSEGVARATLKQERRAVERSEGVARATLKKADHALLLAHPQRPQDHHRPGRAGRPLPGPAHRHRQG